MVTNILHSEIVANTASRLGGNYTNESVDKALKEYAKTCFDLMKEKAPNKTGDLTLVETPLVGYKIKYHESGIKKNPDGTETKIGPNRTITTALPNALLKGINADLVKLVVNVVGAIVDSKKKAA
jgi:hypothetical protein